MEKDLLICDDSVSLGRLLARRFINMGIRSECCRSSLRLIQKLMSENIYHGILLFAFRSDEQLMHFISQAKQSGISVFVGLYTSSSAVSERFRKAGAMRCFIMPCSVSTLCRGIMLRIGTTEDLLPRIEIFLEETGFPRRLGGFCCLAKACELCIRAPERLWGGMSGIYAETAECFSGTSSSVERSLRLLGEAAGENGTLSRLTDYQISQKPTNTELICAVCDAFFRKPYK